MPDNIIKSFRYDFTEAEAHDLALELAESTKELRKINEAKKKAMKEFTGQLNGVKAVCDELSIKVSDGYEMRDVACKVEYNTPSTGQREITRTDTGDVLTEAMTEEDWTLFNQA
jgi:hypothetical protein